MVSPLLFSYSHTCKADRYTSQQSEVEETIKRLQSHKGVQGIVVVNAEGIPIRSTLDNALTVQYAALITQLSAKAKSVVRDLDPTVPFFFFAIPSHLLTTYHYVCIE